MFGMTEKHVISVYNQLKDRCPMFLINSLVLNEGHTIDCLVLVVKVHGQILELYSDGDMFGYLNNA